MEEKTREIGKEELERVVGGGVDPSFFVRPRTKEGQIEFVRQNFEIEKDMGLSYQYACHLEMTKAGKCDYNLLSTSEIERIGYNVYSQK